MNRQRAARAPTFQDRCVTGTRGGLRLSGTPRPDDQDHLFRWLQDIRRWVSYDSRDASPTKANKFVAARLPL